jgi:membrane-associated protease RseP (regulator of RpoE activity)
MIMKTFIAATFASVAVAVWANSFSPVFSPVIGVTEITATSQNTIIPIPYTSLANSANNVTLADLVRTTGLPAGTWLLAFDGDKYEAWTLQDGKWASGTYASTIPGNTVAAGADEKTFAPGGAFWIVLPEPEERNSVNQTIYVYGSYSDNVTSKVPAGKTMLVANPKQGAAKPVVEGAVAKDQMVCIKGEVVTTYTYNGTTWGQWVTSKNDEGIISPVFNPGVPTLGVGEGFWYKSKKTNASENEVVTINWTSVQK